MTSEMQADDEDSGIGGSRIDYFANKFSSLHEQAKLDEAQNNSAGKETTLHKGKKKKYQIFQDNDEEKFYVELYNNKNPDSKLPVKRKQQ
jgi:hypothetical protein